MLILTTKGKQMDNLNKAIKAYGLTDIHPTANIFPMMNKEEFKMLCEDAQRHGFLNSVKITPDKILIDGRNRILASIEIDKDVDLEVIDPPNIHNYILSENLHRRHLNESQKSIISLKLEKIFAIEAKEKMKEINQNNTFASKNDKPDFKTIPPNSAEWNLDKDYNEK